MRISENTRNALTITKHIMITIFKIMAVCAIINILFVALVLLVF